MLTLLGSLFSLWSQKRSGSGFRLFPYFAEYRITIPSTKSNCVKQRRIFLSMTLLSMEHILTVCSYPQVCWQWHWPDPGQVRTTVLVVGPLWEFVSGLFTPNIFSLQWWNIPLWWWLQAGDKEQLVCWWERQRGNRNDGQQDLGSWRLGPQWKNPPYWPVGLQLW